MKNKTLSSLLAAASVLLSMNLMTSCASQSSETSVPSTADALSTIMTRTSVRAYTDQEIEDEKLETILRAAMAAPSAGNKQPWRFVVVKDKAILSAISENLHTMTMAVDAPLAIVVCGDMKATFGGDGLDYWVEDTSAATENLLLAAHSLGLGAVWCGIYPMMERVKFLKDLLKLPEDIVPLNVVPIGYPDEQPEIKDKWKPENIHYNTWENDEATNIVPEKKQAEWKTIDPKEMRVNPESLR